MKIGKTFRSAEISGMGEGYEDLCQATLVDALNMLDGLPKEIFDPNHPKHYKMHAIKEKLLKMYGHSGASWGFTWSHVRYIHENGHRKWLSNFKKSRRKVIDVAATRATVAHFEKKSPQEIYQMGVKIGERMAKTQCKS